MKKFNYTAKSASGNLIRDEVETDSRQSALAELRRRGLTVVTLMEAGSAEPGISAVNRLQQKIEAKKTNGKSGPDRVAEKKLWNRKIRLTEMAVFCRQLAISVNSGLPLREALEGIHEDMDVPKLKRILGDIIKKLHDGIPFSKAIAAHPGTFSPVFIGMIRAAEEAGSLPETLNQLAGYLESSEKLQRKIKSLMAYPSFVAAFFVLICLVMVLAIIPRFQDIFDDLGADLPLLTKNVFSMNQFILEHFPLLTAFIILAIVLYQVYRRTNGGGLRIAKVKLKLPITGICLKRYIVARVCRCMAIMLRSGVPISTALRIVSSIGNNRVIETAIIDAQEKIISGTGIADGLGQTGIFPALLIRMLHVGENAGKLPDVLTRVADAYEEQVEASVTAGTALLEPIIITIFGMMVLLLVISIYLPVFTVSMSIK